MKILYHHRIASKDGQYVHVEAIVNALRKQGHEIVIVSPKIAQQAEFGSDGGWMSKLRSSLPKPFSELMEFSYAFYAFIKLSLAILKQKPDAIYERYNLFFPAGIWAKKLFNLPLVLEVNSPLYDERLEYGGIALQKLALWSEYYTWRNADHAFPVTRVLSHYLTRAGVAETNITVIPNGIDTTKFSPATQKNRDKQFESKLVIGFVGFCREWHRLDELLALIQQSNTSNIMLLIVGDGPASPILRRTAQELNIEDKLTITGIVERNAMPAWLDQIDIALQPAVTPWCSPLKLIEYLAKAKAIIAPNTANIKELLSDGENALLYDVSNPKDIFVKVKTLVEDNELRERLQKSAYQTIKDKQLTWDENANKIEARIKSLISPQMELQSEPRTKSKKST